MDIAILVKEFPPNVIGGTETQTQRMARYLSNAGHDVVVYTKSYEDVPRLDEPYHIKRVTTWHLTPFVSSLTFVLFSLFAVLRDSRQYDILQCMMIYPNGFIGYLLSFLADLRYFAWIRGGDYYFMKENVVKRWMIRRVLSDTTVLVQTERIAADVRSEFSTTDLEVVGNGVDLPKSMADGDKIVFVGRLESQKGVDVLFKAVSRLPNPEPVLIVGDGSERETLEAMANRLSIDVEFTGEVPPSTVPTYLQQGKLFALPAVEGEGLPNAMLEAMAAGLPVVATDTGGITDCIENGKTGYVVQTGDVDALRKRLQHLCTNESHRRKMGSRAREYVRHTYSWDAIVDKVEEIYDHVADRK